MATLPAKVQSALDDVTAYFGAAPTTMETEGSGSVVNYQWSYKAPNGKLQFLAVAVHITFMDLVYCVMAHDENFVRNFNNEVPITR